MAHPHREIFIDGVRYDSVSAVAKAHGVTHQSVTRRIRRYGRTKLTNEELRASSWVDSTKPALTWDFVYQQISSSPKKRGVDSTAVFHAA